MEIAKKYASSCNLEKIKPTSLWIAPATKIIKKEPGAKEVDSTIPIH